MKALKIILGTFLACTMFAFTSVGDNPPQKVKEAFAKKFPTVKKANWKKETATEWEAEFKMKKVEYSANFLEDGTWKETEHEIEETEIPQTVKTALMKAFPDYEIEEAEISETQNGMVYEFEIEKGKSALEVVINTNGKIVNQSEKKANKEDND